MGAVAAIVTAVAAVGGATASVVNANKSSIAAKRSRNAALKAQQEQTAALQALEAEPEAAIPDADATKRARRRSITRQLGRGGRQSTILTGDGGQGAGLGG